MKQWYTYTRNGIFYVQFKDCLTGKKCTAKSTGTRIKSEAEYIIQQWYYDPDSFFNRSQKNTAKNLLKTIIQDSLLSEKDIYSVLNATISEKLKTTCGNIASISQEKKENVTDAQENIKNSLTFKGFLFSFFDYNNSPYIQQLKRLGKKQPNPERFKSLLGILKKYEHHFSSTLLIDIGADEINTVLGAIQNEGKLAESTMNVLKTAIAEVLIFAYNNHLIDRLITGKLTKFATVGKEKEIFTKDELNIIFDKNKNVFGKENYLLVNKLLLKTGCRIGEILGLQIKDLRKKEDGYSLYIGKSYNFSGKRLKETKTNREDFVPISDEMAAELLRFIETSPFKDNKDSFIFYSAQKGRPLMYSQVYENFNKTMKALGIARKSLTIHSYRHTYSSFLQDEGFSDADMLYLTRHKDIKQVLRYSSHITPTKQRKKRQAGEIINHLA